MVERIQDHALALIHIEGLVGNKFVPVMGGKDHLLPVIPQTLDLLVAKLDVLVKVGHEPLVQKLVRKHRAERRAEGECELERDPVPLESVHHPQKRDVGLVHCLIEPVLLKELRILRMPYKRKMRMEYEIDSVLHHLRTPSPEPLSDNISMRSWTCLFSDTIPPLLTSEEKNFLNTAPSLSSSGWAANQLLVVVTTELLQMMVSDSSFLATMHTWYE